MAKQDYPRATGQGRISPHEIQGCVGFAQKVKRSLKSFNLREVCVTKGSESNFFSFMPKTTVSNHTRYVTIAAVRVPYAGPIRTIASKSFPCCASATETVANGFAPPMPNSSDVDFFHQPPLSPRSPNETTYLRQGKDVRKK